MDPSRKGKNFYIALDQPLHYLFKDGDIVSGKCCLLSSLDEDVGSIVISFHGSVKVRIVVIDHTIQAQAGYQDNHYQPNYDSVDVLFSETKILYKGPYTLRKNVLYEWPFQFQFPSGTSLPPSGTFRKDHFNSATVVYEIEACRGRASQEVELLEKRVTPVGKHRNASQSRTLFETIGSFTGVVAIAALQASPPTKRIVTGPAAGRVERHFPVRSLGSHRHGVSRLFHHKTPDVEGTIVLHLPLSLVHGGAVPILLSIETPADVAQPSLQSLEIHFTVLKTVISNLGHHRQTDESRMRFFSQSKIDLPLDINSTLDIGKTFNLQIGSTMIPSFIHARVELHYHLHAQLVVDCGGQEIKQDFLVEDIQILSNRTPNSPLRRDHICVFSSGDRESSLAPPAYPGIEIKDEQFISGAYLRLSRLLTHNFIPHYPITNRNGELSIKLQGQPQLPNSPPSSSQQSSTNSSSNDDQKDALGDDQRLLDIILNEENGYKETSIRGASVEQYAYSWLPPITRSLKERVRGPNISTSLEISVLGTQSFSDSEAPPFYSNASNPFSPIALLNNSLRLIADSQILDESPVLDIEYAVDNFGKELQARIGEIDVRIASAAVAKYDQLRGALMRLGIDLHSSTTFREGKDGGANEKGRAF